MIPRRYLAEAYFDVCALWLCALFILILRACV